MRGEPAERAVVAAVARRSEGGALVAGLDAERRGAAEGHLQPGGDRSDVDGRRRGQRLVIGDRDELKQKRQRGDDRGCRRAPRRDLGLRPPP